MVFLAGPQAKPDFGSRLAAKTALRLPVASASIDRIENQIKESESLRFGSAAIWNNFLEPYRHTGVAKRGIPTSFAKSLLGL
jgi:hypothetical protein